jgi:hypothetical protein
MEFFLIKYLFEIGMKKEYVWLKSLICLHITIVDCKIAK